MPAKRLVTFLLPSYLLVVLVALVAVGWSALDTVRRTYLRELTGTLEAAAFARQSRALEFLALAQSEGVLPACSALAVPTGPRLEVIDGSGKVICDSAADPALAANQGDRPEVRQALAGAVGADRRQEEDSPGADILFVAVPLTAPGNRPAALRASAPLTLLAEIGRVALLRTAVIGAALALLAGFAAWWTARRLSRPLSALADGAEAFVRGELARRVAVAEPEELRSVAEALNRMASALDNRMRAILQQQKEQEAVLSSMEEGVLAVDGSERVLNLNPSAARLFGVQIAQVRGRSLVEVVRNPDLLRFVTRTLAAPEPLEGEIVLRDHDREIFLEGHGTMLRDADGRSIGALVVFRDVTRLRRLENMRRDFVANVSHELKTPVTSIKGFVETLLESPAQRDPETRRFLTIISRQADRLIAIIEDLLNLSRIEQEGERGETVLRPALLRPVLETAVHLCEAKAAERGMRIELDCDAALSAPLIAPLMEQAVVNLVDNAVKYGREGGVVRVWAERSGDRVAIRVGDQGGGIAAEHLPRLFERFYRVDESRSAKLGGTGLGLSIVKHIAQLHGGTVAVESRPGEGSTFSVLLPP
ncbi:MAG: PAS domain-containing protein [SAR324 cluster bacterium]|nr:PAS domain-containing protein [SAR324 cluster bacterium]